MKRLIGTIDVIAFAIYGAFFSAFILAAAALMSLLPRRRYRGGRINKLSFAVFDLISNKYSSMLEDALLNGYISNHHYIYLDFTNRHDRFETSKEGISFHSIAAHPDNGLYNAGFNKMNMLLVELKIILTAVRIASKGNITFVKAHDPHLLGLNGLIISRIFRLPCVLHMNSDFDMKYLGTGKTSSPLFSSRNLERALEHYVMRRYDCIMADREFYKNSPGFPKDIVDKYHAVGVRVDQTHYSEPGSRRNIKEAIGIKDKKMILYVGRLHPVKYPQDAVDALAVVKDAVKDTVLVFAGAGILEGQLRAMAETKGLKDSVLFLGPKRYEDLIDILYSADVMIAPHGGVTLLESALAATPIVAYDFDWHSEFLEDGHMGYIIPFRDIKSMAGRITEILLDKALRGRMSSYCRHVAVSRYSRNRSVEKERAVYDKLIGA